MNNNISSLLAKIEARKAELNSLLTTLSKTEATSFGRKKQAKLSPSSRAWTTRRSTSGKTAGMRSEAARKAWATRMLKKQTAK